ncbi:SCO family protein [Chloroflexus sp.]|uniref:SCO family protein n=1 Tax=Chloroflexus sp. TaxID=1904827 RepID=UPI002FD96C69
MRPGIAIRSTTTQLSDRAAIAPRLLIRSGIVLFIVLLAIFLWFVIARPVKVLPRGEQFPPFALTDQRGARLLDSDLRGRIVFVSLMHSRCGDACAEQTRRLLELRQALQTSGRLGSEVIFLTITLDPIHDTPADLSALAGQLGVDPQSWRFVTGDPREVKQVVGGGLGVYYTEADETGNLYAERRTFLIDPSGMIRTSYPAEGPPLAIALRDIDLLSREMASSGAMRFVYEASHLFVCYPE